MKLAIDSVVMNVTPLNLMLEEPTHLVLVNIGKDTKDLTSKPQLEL